MGSSLGFRLTARLGQRRVCLYDQRRDGGRDRHRLAGGVKIAQIIAPPAVPMYPGFLERLQKSRDLQAIDCFKRCTVLVPSPTARAVFNMPVRPASILRARASLPRSAIMVPGLRPRTLPAFLRGRDRR